MSSVRVWIAALALGAGGVAGWAVNAPSRLAEPVVNAVRPRAPSLVRPGQATAAAAQLLADFNVPPPDAAWVDAVEEPVEPALVAPSDVAADLRGSALAVIDDGAGAAVLVAGPRGRLRRLSAGDIFQDGWRLAAIGRREAVLRLGGREHRVDLTDLRPAAGAP